MPDNKNPGSEHPADKKHGTGVPADNGVQVTFAPAAPVGPGGKLGVPSKALPADVNDPGTVGVESQTFGRGLPANVNR